MKYIAVLFWTLILGQVVGYLGSALTGGTYDFTLTTIISLIIAGLIMLIGTIATPKKTANDHSK